MALGAIIYIEFAVNRDSVDYGGWDGFPAERARVYDRLKSASGLKGVLKLSGHLHHTVLADLIPADSSDAIGVEVLPFSVSRPNIQDVVDDHGKVRNLPRWLVRGALASAWRLLGWLNPEQVYTTWGHGFGVLSIAKNAAVAEIFEVDPRHNHSKLELKARAAVEVKSHKGFHSVHSF